MTDARANFAELRASLEATRARAYELRAASAAIKQRLSTTRQDLAQVLAHARATRDAVREQLALLRAGSSGSIASKPSSAVLQALTVLGQDESCLGEMADDLIAAHRIATAMGDDEMRTLLAGALMQIGRHLATQVGPKAAGVIMN